MANKLYVGNLSYNTDEEGLKQAFTEHGEIVSASVVTDRYTGRSRGFGFVEYADADAAQKAIEAMNGATLDGREIAVSEARERSFNSSPGGGGFRRESGGFGGGGGRSGGGGSGGRRGGGGGGRGRR